MFLDRTDAALKLCTLLQPYKNCNGVVMAVPRGGVPVGYAVARTLQLPLDIVLAKKIGHPLNREYAVGSVSLQGIEYNRHLSDVDPDYITAEGNSILAALKQKYAKFTGGRQPEKLSGKTILLVDDGIATGSTLIAAIKGIRKLQPAKIIVAVPVAPAGAARIFQEIADEYICFWEPEDFSGVGQFYEDFREVTDEDVISILNAAAKN